MSRRHYQRRRRPRREHVGGISGHFHGSGSQFLGDALPLAVPAYPLTRRQPSRLRVFIGHTRRHPRRYAHGRSLVNPRSLPFRAPTATGVPRVITVTPSATASASGDVRVAPVTTAAWSRMSSAGRRSAAARLPASSSPSWSFTRCQRSGRSRAGWAARPGHHIRLTAVLAPPRPAPARQRVGLRGRERPRQLLQRDRRPFGLVTRESERLA